MAGAAVLLAAFVAVEWRREHPMPDLSLFKLPRPPAGYVAAFGLSGRFSRLLYLVLYLQDILDYCPLETGLRLMLMSGRLVSARSPGGCPPRADPVPVGPGPTLVGGGLPLMLGLNASSAWTHLIPGMIVSGLGSAW